jgi:hypothetical protein
MKPKQQDENTIKGAQNIILTSSFIKPGRRKYIKAVL